MSSKLTLLVLVLVFALSLTCGCGSDSSDAADTGSVPADTGGETPADVADVTAEPEDVVEETAAPEEVAVDLGPQEPAPALPKAYSGGVCPLMKEGKNSFVSAGRPRAVQLYLPAQPEGAPVVFIWHGSGDFPTNMGLFFEAEKIAQEKGAIVVIPYECCDSGADCCDNLMVWNYGEFSHLDADAGLFDDTLSCLDAQFDIDNKRVYTTGFSAGSLYSSYLAMNRAEYLAAAAIFSGGCGTVVPCSTPEYNLPAIVAWGGKDDMYVIVSFEDESKKLSKNLRDNGSFVIECDHGQGHTIPWGAPEFGIEFLLAHTWSDGSTPFQKSGVPDHWPEYCYLPKD